MWRRGLLIAVLLAVVAVPAWFVYRTLYTEPGLEFVLQQLRRIPGVRIEVTGASGPLAGPMRIERLVVDHEAVRIDAEGLAFEPRLRQLWNQTLTLRGVSIDRLAVRLKEREPPPKTELHFLPRFLRIVVRDLAVRQVSLTLANGESYGVALISGNAEVTRWTIDLPAVALVDPAGRIDASLRLRAAEPLRLRGEARGHWRLPDERVYRFALDARGHLERLPLNLSLTEPVTMSFSGTAVNLTEGARLIGTLRVRDFDGAPWLDAGALPKASGTIAINAGAASVGLDGTLTAAEFGGEPLRVQGGLVFGKDQIEIAGLRAWLPRTGMTLRSYGSIDLSGERPSLALTSEFERLRWPLTGATAVESPLGQFTLNGAGPYRVDVDALIRGPQIPEARVRARGLVDEQGLQLDGADAEVLRGRVNASGRLSWTGTQPWLFDLNARAVDIGLLRPDLPGRIDVRGRIEGAGFAADAPWTARIDALSGTLLGRAVTGQGTVSHRNGQYELRRVQLRNAGTRIDVDGRVGTTLDLRWDATVGALQLLLPGTEGVLRSSGFVQGTPAAPWVVATGNVRDLRTGDVQVEALDFEIDVDLSDRRESNLDIEAHSLQVGNLSLQRVTVDGKGRASDHRLALRIASSGSEDRGLAPFDAYLTLQGGYTPGETRWSGSLSDARLVYADSAATLIQPAALTLSPDKLVLAPTCFAAEESRLCAEGDWERSPNRWRAIYSAQDWPLRKILTSLMGRRDFDGQLQASGWASQEPGEPWIGSTIVLVDDPSIEIPRNRNRTERVRLGSARFEAFALAEQFRATLDLDIADSTEIEGEVVAKRSGELREHPLQGSIRGRSAILSALPLFVPEIDRSAGELDGEVRISGSIGEPRFDGSFDVREGAFEMYRTNLALRDVSLSGRFVGDELQFEGQGQTRKGALSMDGRFSWPGGVMTGEMRLKGENVLIADTPEYRVQASPNLRFRAANGEFDVDGEIVIPTARITPRDLSTSVTVSPDERIVGELALPEDDELATIDRVRAKVRVTLGDDVRLSAFGLKARLGGSVTVMMRPGDVVRATGEITILEGEYRAFGQDVQITRGRLAFNDSPLGDPQIEIAAERRIEAEDVTVVVNIRGDLRQPFLTLSSTPSMSQTEALSFLLTGRSINMLQSNQASSVNLAAESLAISGGGLLLGGIGRRLGLDEVSVERTGEDDTSVVLGKFLSPRLFVSYGISIAEAINTVKLRYTLNERWSLRGEAGLEQSAEVEFKIER